MQGDITFHYYVYGAKAKMVNKNDSLYLKNTFRIKAFQLYSFLKLSTFKLLGIKVSKLKDQRGYWHKRGYVYMQEILNSGYLDREMFFQNMLIDKLRELEFGSVFEAGCGFGWNIRRAKEEFSCVRVGGFDFSFSQLKNSKEYIGDLDIPIVNSDNCYLPAKDKVFDIGFSVGVFMNIHSSKIRLALKEMIRVCRKYIIHLEYDENHTTAELREKRSFKTNIVSHDYKSLYESLGVKAVTVLTYKDFGDSYMDFQKTLTHGVAGWEGFEGAEKYVMVIIEL